MQFITYLKFFYDDVALLCSVEPDANLWRLEGRKTVDSPWEDIPTRIIDCRFNVTSERLDLWDRLQSGDKKAIEEAFVDPILEPEFPFLIHWNISDWYYNFGTRGHYTDLLQLIAPNGSPHGIYRM